MCTLVFNVKFLTDNYVVNKMETKNEQEYFYKMFDEMWGEIGSPQTVDLTTEVESLELGIIERAMYNAQSNRTHAAKALGISRESLIYKLKKYQISL